MTMVILTMMTTTPKIAFIIVILSENKWGNGDIEEGAAEVFLLTKSS